MQKSSISWLLMLLTYAPPGNALATESTAAPLEMRYNIHREMLKIDLCRARVWQSQLAIFANWKVILSAGAAWLGLVSIASTTKNAWQRRLSSAADFIAIVEIVGIILHGLTRWHSNHIEKELARINN